MSRPSSRFATTPYWKERPDSLEPNLLARDAHRPQSGLSPARPHCWTRQTGAEERAVHFTRCAPITMGLRRRPICAMPYWEERGGRRLSADLGGRRRSLFPSSPLGSIDHSISVSPTCPAPVSVSTVPRVCAPGMIGANVQWKFQSKKTNCGKRVPSFHPHRPPSPSPHRLHRITVPSIVQCPWPGTPFVCACACAAKGCLLQLASIHDHGHWADLHRPSGPRRHG